MSQQDLGELAELLSYSSTSSSSSSSSFDYRYNPENRHVEARRDGKVIFSFPTRQVLFLASHGREETKHIFIDMAQKIPFRDSVQNQITVKLLMSSLYLSRIAERYLREKGFFAWPQSIDNNYYTIVTHITAKEAEEVQDTLAKRSIEFKFVIGCQKESLSEDWKEFLDRKENVIYA